MFGRGALRLHRRAAFVMGLVAGVTNKVVSLVICNAQPDVTVTCPLMMAGDPNHRCQCRKGGCSLAALFERNSPAHDHPGDEGKG